MSLVKFKLLILSASCVRGVVAVAGSEQSASACDRVSSSCSTSRSSPSSQAAPPLPYSPLMSTASRVTRTYSKKHATRYTSSSKIASSSKITPEQSPSKHSPLKRGVDSRSSDEDDSSQGHLSWLQKRRKVTRKSERERTLL